MGCKSSENESTCDGDDQVSAESEEEEELLKRIKEKDQSIKRAKSLAKKQRKQEEEKRRSELKDKLRKVEEEAYWNRSLHEHSLSSKNLTPTGSPEAKPQPLKTSSPSNRRKK